MQEPTYLHERWYDKADENVDEWGIQHPRTVLLAMQEELGELTQAYLEASAEGGDPSAWRDEMNDLGALLIQLHWSMTEHPNALGGSDALK